MSLEKYFEDHEEHFRIITREEFLEKIKDYNSSEYKTLHLNISSNKLSATIA